MRPRAPPAGRGCLFIIFCTRPNSWPGPSFPPGPFVRGATGIPSRYSQPLLVTCTSFCPLSIGPERDINCLAIFFFSDYCLFLSRATTPSLCSLSLFSHTSDLRLFQIERSCGRQIFFFSLPIYSPPPRVEVCVPFVSLTGVGSASWNKASLY
jgi:hypothetical protein